jgi:hypothetical protein
MATGVTAMRKTYVTTSLHLTLGVLLMTSLPACGPDSSNGQTVAINLSLVVDARQAQITSIPSRVVAWVNRWWPRAHPAWAQSVEEIASIKVHITGPGISTPVSTTMPVSNPSSGQVIAVNLQAPAGENRSIVVSAFNGVTPPQKIFGGTLSGVSLTPGPPVDLEIVLVRVFTVTVQKQGTGSGTVTSTPLGIDCGATCAGEFEQGTIVSLNAAPGPGSAFGGWDGGVCSGAVPTCTVVINANQSVTAIFTAIGPVPMAGLTVERSGSGFGTVTSAPSGINCGTTCSASFPLGNSVTLTATPGAGSIFVGWGGACTGAGSCTVTMNSDQTVFAQFDLTPDLVTLTVSKSGRGDGRVTSLPIGIDCGGGCQATFPRNTVLTLTAAPNDISVFDGWRGSGCNGNGTCTITMDGNKNVDANFDLNLIIGTF